MVLNQAMCSRYISTELFPVPTQRTLTFRVCSVNSQEFQDGQVKYLYLDMDRKITEFLPRIEIPLRPFPGTMAVARAEPGQYSSVPPGEYGGNRSEEHTSELQSR